MRTVTKRSELIAGIKAGERLFNVKGKTLLVQCVLASKFNGRKYTKPAVSAAYPHACACCAIAETTMIALAVIAVVGAIAIIAILKDRNLEIEVETDNGDKTIVRVF